MRTSLLAGLLHSGLSDLTNTTWTFNSELSLPTSDVTYGLNFTYTPASGSTSQGIGILFTTEQGDYYMKFMNTQQRLYIAYAIDYLGRSEWGIYSRTITITGGTDATDATLIAWLQANATQTA